MISTIAHDEVGKEIAAYDGTSPLFKSRNCISRLALELFETSLKSSRPGIMLTSPTRTAGVSLISSAIALELAQSGVKTLLLDGRVLFTPNRLSSQLISGPSRKIGSLPIWYLGLTEAKRDHEQQNMPGCSSLAHVLRLLNEEFSMIVIDAPALDSGNEARVLAPVVNGTVLIARRQYTNIKELRKAAVMLSAFGGRVLGTVFNAH